MVGLERDCSAPRPPSSTGSSRGPSGRDRRAGLRPLVRATAVHDARRLRPGGHASGSRRYLLYLCSSPFITPYEVGFVRALDRGHPARSRIRELRTRRPSWSVRIRRMRRSGRTSIRRRSTTSAIWPRAGANPIDIDARADYYDSMFHSVAMVGINTSALIESGIVGRPVFSFLASEFAGHAGRDAALPPPQERRTAACCDWRRRSTSISRSSRASCAAGTMRRGARVRPGVRPPARSRHAGGREVRRGDRGNGGSTEAEPGRQLAAATRLAGRC